MQDGGNSIVYTLELLRSCAKPSIYDIIKTSYSSRIDQIALICHHAPVPIKIIGSNVELDEICHRYSLKKTDSTTCAQFLCYRIDVREDINMCILIKFERNVFSGKDTICPWEDTYCLMHLTVLAPVIVLPPRPPTSLYNNLNHNATVI